uniref:Uncharacterized protein n=1 Tax=Haptolina ericina TaxID=156174 RepID=A0A7S3ARX5_9EUKA|mmetsp:Transcript_32495/g.73363  ORF Transcript_32495/g.73363 Transcript_32495/m.73363 type:complete len:180 (+) Transcript_32495:32-571(+)|eukprot:CAMPEP_0181225542 /NCGR_PEP_ID=MMETSP1096-20121128/31759_1 /TAXON_ID=156174 ORGANISM="Chrysochromulina ericina, Strain CCMP281" /NCGR_SAMPLE_ID=MMETSP1096 /ASSEMBLY_ACC=CAM_ASM_000453 /LENGTH=179 /DNA_ID=CAMNT_0023318785 /DNA_START=32 /DNA_END=571 /DNA_ORIENTATION=-
MRGEVQVTIGLVAAAAVGTAYVLIHERRRKLKAERKRLAAASGGSSSGSDSTGLTRERLIAILDESATAAYQLIEQTRKMVHVKHEQSGISLEEAVDELQRDFQSAMEAVLGAIRMKHGVTEQQMTAAMVANGDDPTTAAAIACLREAMSGKAPANYGQNVAEQAKRPLRRGKSKQRKG